MPRALEKLNLKHRQAARMRVEGMSNQEIAEALNTKPETVVKWWSDPLIREEIDRLGDLADNALANRMATAGIQALEALTEIAQKPSRDPQTDDSTKIRASTEILDRIPSTARVKERGGDGDGMGNIQNILAFVNGMTDQQLAKALGAWHGQEELPAGDVIDGTAA